MCHNFFLQKINVIKVWVVAFDKWLNFSFKSILILIDCQETNFFEINNYSKVTSGRSANSMQIYGFLIQDSKCVSSSPKCRNPEEV